MRTPANVANWLVGLALCIATSAGAAERSRTLRAEFMRQHPCPSTGATKGACPGWQVDHREALVCGGKDDLGNLQWLAVAEHRDKTRVEVKLCRARGAGDSEARSGEQVGEQARPPGR